MNQSKNLLKHIRPRDELGAILQYATNRGASFNTMNQVRVSNGLQPKKEPSAREVVRELNEDLARTLTEWELARIQDAWNQGRSKKLQ